MRVCSRLLATVAILSVVSRTGAAQESALPDSTARRNFRVSLAITAGYAAPTSKDALTQFWKGGPVGGISVLVRAAPGFWIGAGLDVSALWFRESAFAQAYPSVEMQKKNMAWVNIFVLSRYGGFVRSGPVHPYTELAIGASRLSGAEHKEVIDSVRVTYYEIPARTRLALKLTGGMEIPAWPGISFLVEGAVRYVHNDPNVGVGILVNGGVRVTL